jgi:NTP pyrophosphatase (non-canonical NTP hydrolase)
MGYMTDGLTFNTLRRANIARLPMFRDNKGLICHKEKDGSDWSPAQWLQAVVGELGEYANLRKKVERGDFTFEEAKPMLADELADVIIYLDILAEQLGIDLSMAVMHKWNKTAIKVGCPMYIDAEDWHYSRKLTDEEKTLIGSASIGAEVYLKPKDTTHYKDYVAWCDKCSNYKDHAKEDDDLNATCITCGVPLVWYSVAEWLMSITHKQSEKLRLFMNSIYGK